MKQALYIVLVIILTQSCDVPIELDNTQVPSKLVIEGQVTDKDNNSFVYLTWTTQFYDIGKPETETNALVKVTDNDGNVFDFEHSPDSSGLYLPSIDFKGEIGKVYTLSIVVNGLEYSAVDTLFRSAQIDSLQSRLSNDTTVDPDQEGPLYQVDIYGVEPPETENFYKFKFYRNGVETKDEPDDIFITDDRFLAGELRGIPFPFAVSANDTTVLELWGVSRNAFIYYSDLQITINNDGGMFSPPPANPRTNIQGDAMGFFMVASIASDTLIVSE